MLLPAISDDEKYPARIQSALVPGDRGETGGDVVPMIAGPMVRAIPAPSPLARIALEGGVADSPPNKLPDVARVMPGADMSRTGRVDARGKTQPVIGPPKRIRSWDDDEGAFSTWKPARAIKSFKHSKCLFVVNPGADAEREGARDRRVPVAEGSPLPDSVAGFAASILARATFVRNSCQLSYVSQLE
ncbi:unnamed protein product [Prorocentrum cordatum]|uniref:Uncharacterized protein n=1 Tax=Prorocentrum cordatum TaxID=2364126 RepID=A0ABN9SCN9_9DINO|nr:unnamed protein product [Polarella glacialis]